MGKQFSSKTHISHFNKDYDIGMMKRYSKMLDSMQGDSMLDSEELSISIQNTRSILEKEILKLMKKGIPIP